MRDELHLRRKLTLRANGKQIVLEKRSNEKGTHVYLKAFLWAMYLPRFPEAVVEFEIDDRFKPDVVALDADGRPQFWGEAGVVGMEKLRALARRYPETHFAVAKWSTRLDQFVDELRENLESLRAHGPVEVWGFPDDSAERFITADGEIQLDPEQLVRHHIDARRRS